MKRKASAIWEGDLKNGNGILNTPSKVLDSTQYSFKTRFEEGIGTNPEELMAAAHAGGFTMAVAAILTSKGIAPTKLETEAILEVDMVKLNIDSVHLAIAGKVPGITAEEFAEVVATAEKNCIISKALSMPISSEATFVQ